MTFYSHSKPATITNESGIEAVFVFESIYSTIILAIQKFLGKGSGWIIDSVTDHNISISKYNPLVGSKYIKLPEELYLPRRGLINIQNIDHNERFKWSLVRCLHPADHHPTRIAKADKNFAKMLDLKFPVKVRHIKKIKKKPFHWH